MEQLQDKLTPNEHNTDGENFLRICVGRNVPKSHTGETAEGEIEGCDVFGLHGWTSRVVVVWLVRLSRQFVQPADFGLFQGGTLHVPNGVPYACQPMSNEGKGCHEEEQHSCTILGIAIKFASYSDQSEQTSCLEQAYQCGCL